MSEEAEVSPDDFLKQMSLLQEDINDPENRHEAMDDLLCRVLDSLGYGEGVKVYKQSEKWYA